MIIKYFAWIRDITDKEYDEIKNNPPKTINDLKKLLSESYPDLKKHIDSDILRYAINMEYTSRNQTLTSKDEIAIFPPVSGG